MIRFGVPATHPKHVARPPETQLVHGDVQPALIIVEAGDKPVFTVCIVAGIESITLTTIDGAL
jgi:hypothetical protein